MPSSEKVMANNLSSIESQILKFNNDSQVFALRNRYAQKTFLDIMSVARSENRHSAFLAWLLKGDDFAVPVQDHPLVHLLDIIITRVGNNSVDEDKRANNQKDKINNYSQLKKIILTRDIKSIEIEEVKTEKNLGLLCVDKEGTSLDGLPKLDRIDVYIRFSITPKTTTDPLHYEFIIENKIGSLEGGIPGTKDKDVNGSPIDAEFKAMQTIRYFKACTHIDRENKPEHGSIFVYLTPDQEKEPSSPYFIHITYQDVLDNIIEPLLLPEVNTSDRVRLFLEEYISSLSLPAYEQTDDSEENTQQIKNAIIMAVRSEEREQLTELWESSHRDLIKSAIEAYNQTEEVDDIRTLKQFCELNKELIIAILRVALESKSKDNDEELKNAYKDLIKQKHDYSIFKITIDDDTYEYQKGRFFLEITKRWAKAYNNNKTDADPISTIQNLKLSGNNDDTIISEADYNNLATKKQDAKTNPQDRYYKNEEDIITINGTKYYITTQWGQGGPRFQNWLKYIGIKFDSFNNIPNGETKDFNVKSDSKGGQILNTIGIKKITLKRILK